MSRPFPDVPAHPERICWGCDRYCRADDLMCGNGSVRTPHPSELFGDDWRGMSGPASAGAGQSATASVELPAASDPGGR